MTRISIRVGPGASRTKVGGVHRDALVVKVTARAVEGQATEAALAALATALGVRRREIRLISGQIGRNKVVEIDRDVAYITPRIDELKGS